MTPHVSLLVLSRGPVAELDRLLASARRSAADWLRVEVIVRADDDDPALADRVRLLAEHGAAIVVGPRWRGYSSQRAMQHQIVPLARGRWLLPIDDDAEFVAVGWDAALPPVDGIAAAHLGPSIPFWAVTRPWVEALGQLYGGVPIDYWLQETARACEIPIVDLFGTPRFVAHHYKPREAARNAGCDPLRPDAPYPPAWLTGDDLPVDECRRRFAAWMAAHPAGRSDGST